MADQILNIIFTVGIPVAFVVFAVAGISDTFTRFTGGKKISSPIMATMPSGVSLVYFVVSWATGFTKWIPEFPSWKGWIIVLVAGVFVGLLNNFLYDKFLYRIFAKDVTEKIAAGIAEKVTEKITGKDETVEVKGDGGDVSGNENKN